MLSWSSKIIDSSTMKPAVRNIILDGSSVSITAPQARGTVFWQCNVALTAQPEWSNAPGVQSRPICVDRVHPHSRF